MIIKKGYLIFAFFAVSIIACLYGVSPAWFFEMFSNNSEPPSIDQSHILRAVMVLYISLGLFWLWCAFSEKYRDIGIVTVAIFSGGLVLGRILSVFVDGIPSPLFVLYIVMELSLVPVSIWILKRPD